MCFTNGVLRVNGELGFHSKNCFQSDKRWELFDCVYGGINIDLFIKKNITVDSLYCVY